MTTHLRTWTQTTGHKAIMVLGLIAASATAAFAAPAETRGPAYLYEGPNPRAEIVMTIPPNALVDVEFCRRGWCRVSWRYQAGFTPAAALRFRGGGYVEAPPRTVYVEPAPPVVVVEPY